MATVEQVKKALVAVEELCGKCPVCTPDCPVAIAKMIGRYSPPALAIVTGISMPKYKTPLYGQNAMAKTIPNNRVPQ